jgi:hypothetical protein
MLSLSRSYTLQFWLLGQSESVQQGSAQVPVEPTYRLQIPLLQLELPEQAAPGLEPDCATQSCCQVSALLPEPCS